MKDIIETIEELINKYKSDIDKLQAENARYRPALERIENELDAALMVIANLKTENARYREALVFYADEKNWLGYHDRCTDVLNDDVPSIASDGFKIVVGGRRAREALKGGE